MYILFIFPAKLSSSVERRRIQETINLLGLAWHALCFNNIFSQGSVAHFPAKKNTLQINVFYIVTILCCSEFSLIRPSNAHYGLLYAYKFVTMFLKYDNVPHQWNGTLPQEVLLYWKDLLPTHQHGVIICFPSSELKKTDCYVTCLQGVCGLCGTTSCGNFWNGDIPIHILTSKWGYFHSNLRVGNGQSFDCFIGKNITEVLESMIARCTDR